MSEYIGVVDLTVRLSSMNPLGHIDVQDANRRFERVIVQSCKTMYDDAKGKGETATLARYEAGGIVPQGASEKLFHFEEYSQIISFARTVRSRLIAERLPFKICISKGRLGSGNLREKVADALGALASMDSDRQAAAEKVLLDLFNSVDPQEIDKLLQLYRASSPSESSVALSTAMEGFKGFGIWIDTSLLDERPVDLFVNYFPVRNVHRRLINERFLDCPFNCDPNDVVYTLMGDGEADSGARKATVGKAQVSRRTNVLASGHSAMIDSILDLLKRSRKAGEENAIYYVSLLTAIVRSSHFAKIEYLTKSKPFGTSRTKELTATWQNYPPIFQTLALDQHNRAILRKVPGIDLTLAAMIDQVHAALTNEPASSVVGVTRPARDQTARDFCDGMREHDSIFGKIVRHIEAHYGESMMRRIWAVPADVMNEERKRAMLEVMTDRQ